MWRCTLLCMAIEREDSARGITTVVVPAAGMGTRFLPATKTVPKELLPVVDTPGIELIAEEAASVGARRLAVITAPDKQEVMRHFEAFPELVDTLESRGKDEQVAKVSAEADEIARAAATLKASLDDASCRPLCAVAGPVLAAAVHQVLASTADDPDFPVLGGVRVEVDGDGITLTATDRYRLATRTLVASRLPEANQPWAATVSGRDLAASTSLLRRSPSVGLEASSTTLDLCTADGAVTHCRLLTADYPDRSLLLDSLAAPTHRVTVGTRHFLKALEQAPAKVGLHVAEDRVSLLLPEESVELDGTSTGHDITIWFELTTLYPALSNALGSDVILDLRSTDQPATVRSADDGDLTTLVMPCRPN